MKLKKLRLQQLLSARALARLTGISRQMILNYEKGKSVPGKRCWDRLVKVLGIKEDYASFWGKERQEVGRPSKYAGKFCRFTGCTRRPASRGLCALHYSMVRNRLLSVATSWGTVGEEILGKLIAKERR